MPELTNSNDPNSLQWMVDLEMKPHQKHFAPDQHLIAKKAQKVSPNPNAVHPIYKNKEQQPYANIPKYQKPPMIEFRNGLQIYHPPNTKWKSTRTDREKPITPLAEAAAMGSWTPHTVQDGSAYKKEQAEAYKQQKKLDAQKAKHVPDVMIPKDWSHVAPGVERQPGPSLAQMQQQGYNYAEMMRAKQRQEAANKIPPPGPIHTPEHNPAHATGPQSKTPVQQQTQRGTTRPEQAKTKTFLPQFFSPHQKPHQPPPRVQQQQNYYNDPRRGLVPQQYGYTVQPQPGNQMRPVQHYQYHYIDPRRGHVPQQYGYTVPQPQPQYGMRPMYQPGHMYARQHALYNIGLHESSAISLDIHEEDDSDMIHTNSKQDMLDMLDMQDDKTLELKQNLSKEKCYLVQTTTL